MKTQWSYYLLLCLVIACSTKGTKHNVSNSTEFFFKSSDKDSVIASIDLSEQETKKDAKQFTITASKSIEIPLVHRYHIVGLEFYPSYYEEIIVSKGDKISIEHSDGMLSFFKTNDDKKEEINTIQQQIIFDSSGYQNLQKQTQLFLETKINNQTRKNDDVLSLLQHQLKYFHGVFRNIEKRYKSDEYKLLLIKSAKVQLYENLSKVNAQIKSDTLSNFLKSKQFLNETNLNDRVLSKLFVCYNHYNIFKHPRNKSLTEKYNSEFRSFSTPLQSYFKRLVISTMINDKYDRKTIGKFIDDYEKNYGVHEDIEVMKQEIEYGIKDSKDLKLIGIDHKPETWETLICKYRGKKIYVDFWASWCRPCISELPYSKKMKAQSQDIVFIYLALNDKEDAWRKSTTKYNLFSNSYLITNPKSSQFILEHNISTIPRYMIVNENGKIINPDAPRPSSGLLKDML